jgi:hypothetical protein
MKQEPSFNATAFGQKIAAKVDQVGGFRAAHDATGVPTSSLHYIAKGRRPNVDDFWKLHFWLYGEYPTQ